MPSNWPTTNDTFSQPINPAKVPLKSAGSSSRVHSENHRDLGDAVEKIQQNAAKLTHAHDGVDSAQLPVSSTHQSADTDQSPSSLHHTLGTSANQATKGNHTHNGSDSLNIPVSSVIGLEDDLDEKMTRTPAMLPGRLHPFLLMGRKSFYLRNSGSIQYLDQE